MLKKTRTYWILATILISLGLEAQEPLSFEEALSRTLESNYGIRIALIDEAIAENNASRANNNYLPTLNATGSYTWTYNEGNFKLVTGDQSFDPNSSYNYTAGISLNYTLFDGQGRRFTYLQSQEAQELTSLQVRGLIESTVIELGNVFHEVARLEEAVESLEEAVSISVNRLTRAQYAYDYGQSTQLDKLNAKVDLNVDSINLVNAQQQLANFQRNLNLIMGEEVDKPLDVSEQVQIRMDIIRESALASALENNTQVESVQHSLRNSELAIKSSKAGWFPNLGANLGYNYRGSDDPNGAFVLGSSSYGPTAGVSLNWNLFNGQTNTRVQNAKLGYESQLIERENTEQSVKSDVLNAYDLYRTSLFILNTQADNVSTARINFDRSEEAFKLGQLTSVEFRQAQLNLLNAQLQFSQSKYAAKNAEIQLLAFMGELVD
ncbi:MAG: TolC family protein [Flavobacteriales bacterium]|nr:TolC family protein [Flavobacteriales bacterium]NNK80095.1 TolC family protein [Flavobacteriales bacterium]